MGGRQSSGTHSPEHSAQEEKASRKKPWRDIHRLASGTETYTLSGISDKIHVHQPGRCGKTDRSWTQTGQGLHTQANQTDRSGIRPETTRQDKQTHSLRPSALPWILALYLETATPGLGAAWSPKPLSCILSKPQSLEEKQV